MASSAVDLQSESPDSTPCCSNTSIPVQKDESDLKVDESNVTAKRNGKISCESGKEEVLIMHDDKMSLDWSRLENDCTSSSNATDVPVHINGLKSGNSGKIGQTLKSRPIQVHAKGWSLSADNQVPVEKQPSNSSYSYSTKQGKMQHSSPKSYSRASSSKHYSVEAPNVCQLSGGASGVTAGGHVPGNGEHVVLLHVNPGETISFFMGDHTQLIQGPATVRMVSCNSTPPMPLPVQVPPGHMVQQIVDENGTLRHIILSPQPPIAVPVGSPYSAASSSGSPSTASAGGPSPFFVYPHHSYPPHMQYHSHLQPGLTSQSPHNHGGHMQHSGSSSGQASGSQGQYPSSSSQANMNKDERTQKQFFKLKKRLEARQKDTGRSELHTWNEASKSTAALDVEESKQNSGRDQSKTCGFLSAMKKPEISEMTARSALVMWSTPLLSEDLTENNSDIELESILYKILVSDKGQESPKKVIYSGKDLEYHLKDLKPGSLYSVCVQATLNESSGKPSESVSFRTLACKPDQPQPPKLLSRTKTSIFLKWNAALDNGSRILGYALESVEGFKDDNFADVFYGLQKQFKAVKLKTSTCYRFRLAAVNEFGKSEYSEVVCFSTSGSAPSQPPPPELVQARNSSLNLKWEARPNDDSFTLQMEEEGSLHGFLPVFNGKDATYTCGSLRRNSEYKFRLCANNDEGCSPWSQTVSFSTLPEKPASPAKPSLKGRVHSTSFKVAWEPPKDDGGTDISSYDLEMDSGNGFEIVYSGTELESQCDNLQPATNYLLRVRCTSKGGTSEFSEPLSVQTLAVIPGKCQSPRAVGKPKANTVHIKWAAPEYDGGSEILEFEVEIQNPDDTTRMVYKGTGNDCVVAALFPGRQYAFYVRAYNKIGHGPWSEHFEVTTGAGTPDVPDEIQAVPRSPHSVFVSWTEPQNNGAAITEYRLEACQSDNFQPVYVGSQLNTEIRNLIPASTYLFRVQAINSAGASAFSESVRCQMPSSSPGGIPVSNVKVVCDSTAVSLTWKEPNDNGATITSYNVEVGDIISTTTEVSELRIESLTPETTYRVRIQAVNNIGLGPFTSFKVTTRGLPPNPPILECCGYSHNSLRLKWGDGKNPEYIQYTLEMHSTHTGSFTPVYQGTGNSYKISRLEELTPHSFRIYASNSEGEGPYSDVFVFSTTKAVPPSPKQPKVSSVTENCCLVEWMPSKSIGDDMVSYKLQIGSKASDYIVVYSGINTSFIINDLNPSTEYSVRVAAVRHCSDSSGDLCSPYSQSTAFCTTGSVSPAPLPKPTSVISSLAAREPLTDQQWAMIILCGFTVFAIFIAMLIHWLLTTS